jgi:hypothetical protein
MVNGYFDVRYCVVVIVIRYMGRWIVIIIIIIVIVIG